MTKLTLIGVCVTILLCCSALSLPLHVREMPHPLASLAPQLIALDCEEATIQVAELTRYAEAFVACTDGAPPRMYICPKDCERGKIYSGAPSKTCPICKYRLYEIRNGKIEHSDHHPKHGGVFFMGPDGWHHVEGVLASATEFRLYVYDNFTEPLSENCSGVAEVSPADKSSTKIKLTRSVDGAFFTGAVPAQLGLPLSITVRIRFGARIDEMLFNFSFNAVGR
jgi:hypothetical protein